MWTVRGKGAPGADEGEMNGDKQTMTNKSGGGDGSTGKKGVCE